MDAKVEREILKIKVKAIIHEAKKQGLSLNNIRNDLAHYLSNRYFVNAVLADSLAERYIKLFG